MFVTSILPNIFLVEFNINAQGQDNHLKHIFSDYMQIVTEKTQISGAVLNHVYSRNDFLEYFDVHSFVKTVYFSDQDAVKFKL